MLTHRRLNRSTLSRQLLLGRERSNVGAAMAHVVAMQAQEPASPYVALWNRIADFDPADLDAAFASGAVVRANLMRVTLHAVSAEDYPAFRQAMLANLRTAGLADRRFLDTGMSIRDADRLLARLDQFAAVPRTRGEIWAMLEADLGAPPPPGLWRALRISGALLHEPTAGPWSFGRVAVFRSAPPTLRHEATSPLASLFRRYLEGFGPASVADFAQFSALARRRIRTAMADSADDLVVLESPEGEALYDLPGAPLPDGDAPAPPRLMAMWDSVLLAYADRSRIIPEPYRRVVIRRNGDVLPTLLVDGFVAGVWRPVDEGIEVTAFHDLGQETWDLIERQATSLVQMLSDREHLIYRRYRNWWNQLPAGSRRTFVP